MTAQSNWTDLERTPLHDEALPYSFVCDGENCDESGRTSAAEAVAVDAERGAFPEADCVEWTFGLRNTGDGDSPILSGRHSLDLLLAPLSDGAGASLRWSMPKTASSASREIV